VSVDNRCAAEVLDAGSYRSRRCTRDGTFIEDGKRWCKQHAPSLGEKRLAAKNAQWDAESERKGREFRMARAAPALLAACKNAVVLLDGTPMANCEVAEECRAAMAAAEGKEGKA
jgi:hypothetical protein